MTDENTSDQDDEQRDRLTGDAAATLPHTSTTYKVLGETDAIDGVGVLGHNTATTGSESHGVRGATDSPDGGAAAIFGESKSGSGVTYGVYGSTNSSDTSAAGVRANASEARGVDVSTFSGDGIFVDTNTGIGVHSESVRSTGGDFSTDDANQTGLKGEAKDFYNPDGSGYGVEGETEGAGDGAAGVYGRAQKGSGKTYGVDGRTDSSDRAAAGVRGRAEQGSGETYGVEGVTRSPSGVGVRGAAPVSEDLLSNTGVLGKTGSRGWVDSQTFEPFYSTGVRGEATASSGVSVTAGVYGTNDATSAPGHGVLGETTSRDPNAAGVRAVATSGSAGVIAYSSEGTGLEVTRGDSGTNIDPSAHAALIDVDDNNLNNSILALRAAVSGQPTDNTNFATFFDGGDNAYGAIEGNGNGDVSLNSGAADYAEFMPRRTPGEFIEEGDVVGVVGGEVTRDTAEADQALVVTGQPIVAGNSPGQEPGVRERYETVAFVGQVPVKVRGTVSKGDLIVPSGDHDGTGRAIPAGGWTPGDGPVVGRAWEATDETHVDRVTVAVGLETGEALEPAVAAHRRRIEDLETENERLREECERLDGENERLRTRLETLERRVAAIAGESDSAAPADD